MVTASSPTLLAITGLGVAPYSARGLQQTLAPIQQATNQRRTINGDLDDLSFDGFQKYTTTISGQDQLSPVCDGVWPGRQVTIDCITELAYLTEGGSPEKTVVPNSSRTEGDFTYYRPRLVCLVGALNIDTDEWGAKVGWTMTAEEV